ncbi:DivIVA domain-containing protein [candidate division KSB1 bacterium]|nr:DivIVA domain-containing protein [candidate division KSB1 bacterium]
MKITPLDIKKQDFKKVLRGLDPIEVETFLEMVSEEFESLIREKNTLSDEVLKLKTQLKDYQEVEKTFKESLMSAQQTINQSRENSQKEANLIIREAEIQAEKILEDTKIQLIEMKNELMVIRAQKDSFAKRLRHLFESQLELLGVLELDDLSIGRGENTSRATAPKGNLHQKQQPAQKMSEMKSQPFPGRENPLKSTGPLRQDEPKKQRPTDKDDKQFSDQFII